MSSPLPPDQWPRQSHQPDEEFFGVDPDEDTGPLHVQSSTFVDRYAAPFTVDPRAVPVTRTGFRYGPLLAGAAAVVAVAGAAVWLLWPSSDAPKPRDANVKPSPSAAPEPNSDQRKLLGLLPAGYPSAACSPADVPEGALASVTCTRNSDAGGPPAATYTLFGDKTALGSAFDSGVGAIGAVVCPGNIQSPGPWRRNATPGQVAGTVVCGIRDGVPTVAWTTDADLLLSSTEGAQAGPSLGQLYAWWSSHS